MTYAGHRVRISKRKRQMSSELFALSFWLLWTVYCKWASLIWPYSRHLHIEGRTILSGAVLHNNLRKEPNSADDICLFPLRYSYSLVQGPAVPVFIWMWCAVVGVVGPWARLVPPPGLPRPGLALPPGPAVGRRGGGGGDDGVGGGDEDDEGGGRWRLPPQRPPHLCPPGGCYCCCCSRGGCGCGPTPPTPPRPLGRHHRRRRRRRPNVRGVDYDGRRERPWPPPRQRTDRWPDCSALNRRNYNFFYKIVFLCRSRRRYVEG